MFPPHPPPLLGVGYSTKFCSGRFRPEVQPFTLFVYRHFVRKVPFRIPVIEYYVIHQAGGPY